MAFVEQVDVEGFSGPELQHILTNTPHRSKLIFNSKCKSDVWENYRLILVDGILVPNQCACIRCKTVFTSSRNAGTSHQKSCSISSSSTLTQLSLDQITLTKQKFKLNKEELEAVKDSELAICALGYQSFHSLESERLSKFAQTFVNLGAKRGRFEVSIKEGSRKKFSAETLLVEG